MQHKNELMEAVEATMGGAKGRFRVTSSTAGFGGEAGELGEMLRDSICFVMPKAPLPDEPADPNVCAEVIVHLLPYERVWVEFPLPDGAIAAALIRVIERKVIRAWSFVRDPQRVWVIINHVADDGESIGTTQAVMLGAELCKYIVQLPVVHREVDAPLQKARAKRGKKPLFSYWELDLSGVREAIRSEGGAATDIQVRAHLRRGNWARAYERTVRGQVQRIPPAWRPAAVVGNKALGMIHKDYKITPSEGPPSSVKP